MWQRQILGIPVEISYFTLIFFILYPLVGLWWEGVLLFALLISHELAHIFMARAYAVEVKRLEIWPFGGVARLADIEEDAFIEAAIALAGPVHNLLLFFGGLLLWQLEVFTNPYWIGIYSRVNLGLALFNLLPAWPLDGSRVYRLHLSRILSPKEVEVRLKLVSRLTALFLVVIGVLSFIWYSGQLDFIIAGILLLFASRKDVYEKQGSFPVSLWQKKSQMINEGIMQGEALVVHQATPVYEVIDQLTPGKIYVIFVVDDSLKLLGILSEGRVAEAILYKDSDTEMGDLVEKHC